MRTSANSNLIRSLADFALNRARSVAQTLQTMFVYRPGEPNPSGCVYNDFATLYAQYSNLQNVSVQGPKVIQIDDSFVSPAVVPAGVYDLHNTSLIGVLHANISTECELADGVVFNGLANISNKLTLRSKSTTVPVRTLVSDDLVLIERGSNCQNDPTATVPFFHVPSGLVAPPILVALSGGQFGTTGNHCLAIDVGASAVVALDAFAAFANDIVTGLGSLTVIVTSQSTFTNTPFPILQPALAVLTTLVYDFASFVSFQNLTASNWGAPPPANVEEAINRMAALVQLLNGGVPIP